MLPEVSAIVLAAGSSSRMGRPKQLLPLGPRTVIRRCLDGILAAGVADIVVVLGEGSDAVVREINGLPVKTAENRAPRSEMAESVRIGLRQIAPASTAVLVCLSDHPLVSPETIRKLIAAHGGSPDSIIIPLYRGKRGHPTLFPREVIEEVHAGRNLREVISRHSGEVLALDAGDEGVILDLDTPEEYERVKDRFI